jgi:predicted nucleic acid-binding protein
VEQNLPLGDAFAAAAAEEHACPVVTADHADFDKVYAASALNVIWLR